MIRYYYDYIISVIIRIIIASINLISYGRWDWRLVGALAAGPLRSPANLAEALGTQFFPRVLRYFSPREQGGFAALPWGAERLERARLAQQVVALAALGKMSGNVMLKLRVVLLISGYMFISMLHSGYIFGSRATFILSLLCRQVAALLLSASRADAADAGLEGLLADVGRNISYKCNHDLLE